ncbi:MAG: helix-turn-helix transcriptional regulator [Acidobacteriaceae bacterium]
MAAKTPRITGPTLKVIGEFFVRPTDPLSGIEISRTTGLASGTLYPILFRLEEAGWLESEWEEVVPAQVRRPRRRLYRITALGESNARASFREFLPRTPEFAL